MVEVLLDAVRQAERRDAYREALQLHAELVELLPPDDQRWLEVLDAMYARGMAGRPPRGNGCADRARGASSHRRRTIRPTASPSCSEVLPLDSRSRATRPRTR